MLFPYAPLPPPLDLAGTKRNLPFLLELCKRHEVTVLSYGSSDDERMFREAYGTRCAGVRFVNNWRPRLMNGAEKLWLLGTGRSPFRQIYRQSMQQAIDQVTSEQRFDVIHCCVQMFGYFRFPEGVPVTSDTHEVKHDLLRRTAAVIRNPFWKLVTYLSFRLGESEEASLCRRFRVIIATTEPDKALFRKLLPHQRIEVIQNGVGESFLEELNIDPIPNSMAFTGLFSHAPNSQGILHFLDEIFPLIQGRCAEAKVTIVGKAPPRELTQRRSDSIIITGFVKDVRPYIAQSLVFIIPLLAGGGIRGKALEAMAMRRPIVTTTIGVEGIELYHDRSALFADSPGRFADAVLRLFAEPALRKSLASKAFETVVQNYDWRVKGQQLESVLLSVVQ